MKWCIHSDYNDVENNMVKKESCIKRPCIVSTCPFGEMNFQFRCVKMADMKLDFSEILTLYKLESGEVVKTSRKLDNVDFQIVTYANRSAHVNKSCAPQFLTNGSEYLNGHFLTDGSFLLLPTKTILPAGEYVVRFAATNESGTLRPVLKLKFARDDEDDPDTKLRDRIFGGVMLVSCFFIILLLVVYSLCEELRTTPGVILMAYVAAFGICFLLRTIQEFTLIDKKINPDDCYTISVLIRFFTLCSYCWMSIMSFAIWSTLKGIYHNEPKYMVRSKSVDWCKFCRACCIASLLPLAYVVIEVCLDEYTDDYRPYFSSCTVGASVWHLAAILLPLQGFNLVLFVLSVFNLRRIQRDNQAHLNNSVSTNTRPAKQTALIIIKISMMMGVNWFLDILLLLFYRDLPEYVKNLTRMYNSSIGVIMFLLCVVKADVLLKLFRKLAINNGITRSLEMCVSREHRTRSRSCQRNEALYELTSQPDPDFERIE